MQLCHLQVSMQCAEQMGCQDSIVKFVLPLGATINMNGTALYEATTVIFIAQVRTAARQHRACVRECMRACVCVCVCGGVPDKL